MNLRTTQPINFGSIAKQYDAYKKKVTGINSIGYHAVLAALGDLTGKTVLDIGCGSGNFTRELANRGAAVVGVDIANEMISLATAQTTNSLRRLVRYRLMKSNGKFGLPPRSIDAAVATFCFCTMPRYNDVEANLQSLRKAIKPGGRLVILHANYKQAQGQDFGTHRVEAAPGLRHEQAIKVFLAMPGGRELRLQDFYYSPSVYRRSLERFGFEQIRCRRLPAPDGRKPLLLIFARRSQHS